MNRDEKIEVLAHSICGKPPEISPSKCRATIGTTNPLCNECETCRIARNSDEQLDYVLSSIEDCMFLKACPGSGKTEVVGLKAAYEMSKWVKTPGGIAVLTFTNNAAEVIEKRVSQFGGIAKIGFPHFIGTIDGWLHGYIAHPFAHIVTKYNGKSGDRSIRVIDNHSQADFLHSFKTKNNLAQTGKPAANEYYFDVETKKYVFASANRNIDYKRNLQNLEMWQVDDLKNTKLKFKKAGFATYQDIEHICYEILTENTEHARFLSIRFPLIIVDECQDLSWIQMQILDKMRCYGTVLHFIGDLNQAIYEFKKVEPEKVKKYAKEHEFNILSLSNNYRNCQSIANLCDTLVDNTDKVMSIHEGKQLESPCVCVPFEKDDMMKLPIWFNEYLDRFGIDKQCSTIVTRSWANVYRMRRADYGQIKNYQGRLVMAIHLWKTGCRQATGDALKLFGRFVSEKFFPGESTNSREYYRPESVDSALIWRMFMAAALRECCQDELLCNLEQNWKMWTQAVRDRLHKHLKTGASNFGATLSDFEFLPLVAGNKTGESSPVFKAPSDESNKQVLVAASSNSSPQAALRITTIHNVKGETLEALMLVSSRDKSGTSDGYWTQWLDDPASEAARLAYVASSRPRKLIIWAIPNPSKMEKDRLKKVGFQVLAFSTVVQKSQTKLDYF
ncbi:MAG: UvrD-helicase domain-containing protein [Methanothrix sp.]|nr:UvrD-helicase domain-containing protein [Methanothrix sp.]